MATPGEVERIAGALSGQAVEPITGDWYPAEVVQLRARDGSMATVEADRHPDPLAEAVRASIAEAELLQSVGRVRGLNRTAEDPVEVVLLSNVPVPGLPVDELRQWEGPSIDEEIFARFGAALESAGDAATVAGINRKAIDKARERMATFSYKSLLYGNVANLCQATYQLAGPGRSRQGVVYDPRRIADCRAWVMERLGPLVHFSEVEREQPAEQPAAAVRCCTHFIDTTGDVFRRCGEPIADGLDRCPVHRAQYARTLSTLVDAAEWIPETTLPPRPELDWRAVLAASGPQNNPAGRLIPLGQVSAEDAFIVAGLGVRLDIAEAAA
jgi:hypothetical protein